MKCDLCDRSLIGEGNPERQVCQCGVFTCPECWAEHADKCMLALWNGPVP